MICPDCGGTRIGVIDNAFNPETNEAYRLRKCKDCLYRFYTIEFEVEATTQFKNDFYGNSRHPAHSSKVAAERKKERRLTKEKRLKEKKANAEN